MPVPAEAPSLISLSSALGIGLLVGLVYERRKVDDATISAGLRSHALASLMGVVSLWLGLPAFLLVLLLTGAFVALGYWRTSQSDLGLTAELALVCSALLGGMALHQPAMAGALAVVVALLVFAKSRLHQFSRELLSHHEVADGLMLLAFSLIVLPLLPNHPMDPWGLLNPATVWRLALLVMAVSALGHVALRLVGTRWGLLAAGFFSGYVSSTAATAGFGQQAQQQPALLTSAIGAAMLANLASLSLLVPIFWTVAPGLLQATRWPLLAAGGTLLAIAAFGIRRSTPGSAPPPTADTRMFRLGHAVAFAAMITGVMVGSKLLGQWLGPNGAILATVLAALAELHSAAAGVAGLHRDQLLDSKAASWTVIGLLAASALAKSMVAFSSGGRAYGSRVAGGLAAMTLAATLATLLV